MTVDRVGVCRAAARNMLLVLTEYEITHARHWSNDEAYSNMASIVVTALVSQDPISWSNDVAPRNIFTIVSRAPSSCLAKRSDISQTCLRKEAASC